MPSPAIITSIYDGRARVTFSSGRHTYMVTIPSVAEKLWQPSVTGMLGKKAKPALTGWAAKESLKCVGRRIGEYESRQTDKPPYWIQTAEVRAMLAEAEEGWNTGKEASIGTLAHAAFKAQIDHLAGLGAKPTFPILPDPVTLPDYTPAMIELANASIATGLQFIGDHKIKPVLVERPLWSPSTGIIGTVDFIGYIDDVFCVADWKTSKRLYPEYRVQLAEYAKMYQEEFSVLPEVRWAINTKKDGGLEHEIYGIDTYSRDLRAFDACVVLYDFDRETDEYSKGEPRQILGNLDLLVPKSSGRIVQKPKLKAVDNSDCPY